ncbi:hypothetical protein ABI59_18225 [Acidobacteria bacterium Mor1]|nr:hypothetical protein ABI59_18225 [Acidobacteria bacterium Mor1]
MIGRYRTWLPALCLAGLLPALAAAQTVYVSPDVTTDLPGGVEALPSEVARYDGAAFSVAVSFPANPAARAVHRMDACVTPGTSDTHWLLAVAQNSDLGNGLTDPVETRDVVRFDGTQYSLFFCGDSLSQPLPSSAGIDGLFLEGDDNGDLLLALDGNVEIGGTIYRPGSLLRYTRSGSGCADWSFVAVDLDLRVSSTVFPTASRPIGVDRDAGVTAIAWDIPVDLSPTLGAATQLPGEIVSWDGSIFDEYLDLLAAGWPIESEVDGLSLEANPGAIDGMDPARQIRVARAGTDLDISFGDSCSCGAGDYGIYEGTIASLQAGSYDHQQIRCGDAGSDRVERITPASGDTYYLVVPTNAAAEGSYGSRFDSPTGVSTERPQPVDSGLRCRVEQVLTACP